MAKIVSSLARLTALCLLLATAATATSINIGRVSRFLGNGSTSGTREGTGFGTTGAFLWRPSGCTFDAAGNFYVADTGQLRRASRAGWPAHDDDVAGRARLRRRQRRQQRLSGALRLPCVDQVHAGRLCWLHHRLRAAQGPPRGAVDDAGDALRRPVHVAWQRGGLRPSTSSSARPASTCMLWSRAATVCAR
jgi:hypothetical protein